MIVMSQVTAIAKDLRQWWIDIGYPIEIDANQPYLSEELKRPMKHYLLINIATLTMAALPSCLNENIDLEKDQQIEELRKENVKLRDDILKCAEAARDVQEQTEKIKQDLLQQLVGCRGKGK